MGKSKPTPNRRRRANQPPANDGARNQNGKPARPRLSANDRELIKTLQSWLEDESGYDEETWPWLKKALEEDRLSARRLFRE